MRWLIFFIYFIGFQAQAIQETNGGNPFVAEFFNIFDEVIDPQSETCFQGLLSQHPNIFKRIQDLRTELVVKTEPYLMLRGVVVGAVNYPFITPRQLILSEDKWVMSNAIQKKALVLHELIYLIGIDDQSYQYSSLLLNCLDQGKKRREVQVNLFRSCNEVGLRSLVEGEIQDNKNNFGRMLLLEAIFSNCAAGFYALQRNNLLRCDSACHHQICSKANGFNTEFTLRRARNELEFLATLLGHFERATKVRTCEWKLCQDSKYVSLLEDYPDIQKVCASKK